MSSDAPTTADGESLEEKGWDNPFPEGTPIHDLYERRISNGQDLLWLIDDYHARRGTAKTVGSLQVGEGMDQNGGLTWENATMNPKELREAYYGLPERSSIVFDEGELGASNREAMTLTNRAVREIISIGRVEEKYLIINTPSLGFIDRDIRMMADVWATATTKGTLLIHALRRQPYANELRGKLIPKKKCYLEFKDIPTGTRLRDIYNKLTKEKKDVIYERNEDQGLIRESEAKKREERARKKGELRGRNDMIRAVYEHPEIDASQRKLGHCADITQQAVFDIIHDEG